MENLQPASSNLNLWNAAYQLPEGTDVHDADIENFNQYCNMIIFNNGPQVNPQLRTTAMQMQSFMDAMKQHGASKKELYNFAQASLPMLQREHEKLSLCSVKIEEIRGDRLQRRGAMLNKISGTQFNLTNFSTQKSIFEQRKNLTVSSQGEKHVPTYHNFFHSIELSEKNEKQELKLKSYAKDYALKKVSKTIKCHYGKPTALAVKMLAKTALGSPPEGSENPTRDLLISTSVSIGLAEVVQFGIKRTPAYMGIALSNIVHDVAVIGQESTTQIQQNEEIKELWNKHAIYSLDGPSFESSTALAQGFLSVVRTPGDILHSIQNKISSEVIHYADKYGFTEKNVARVFNHYVKFINENNPKLFEDMYLLQH